jgi:hypothetical protein
MIVMPVVMMVVVIVPIVNGVAATGGAHGMFSLPGHAGDKMA